MGIRHLCLVCLLWISVVLGESQTYFQFYAPKAELLERYDISTKSESYDVQKNVKSYFDWAETNGSTLFITEAIWIGTKEIVEPWDSATIWFPCTTLVNRGFKQGPDILSLIVEEAHDRGCSVYVNIEHLAHIIYDYKEHSPYLQEMLPADIGKVIDELKSLGIDGVYEEAFGDAYIEVIENKTNTNQLRYFHCFNDIKERGDYWVSEDYLFYPTSQEYIDHVASVGDVGNTIGNLTLTFGQANAIKKPMITCTAGNWGFQPGMQLPIALYRMIQFDPVGTMFWPADEEDKEYILSENEKSLWATLLKNYDREFGGTYAPRPKANLIIDMPADTEIAEKLYFKAALTNAVDFITNSLSAAGYEIFVSYDSPIDEPAECYFIYAIGDYSSLSGDMEVPAGYDELSPDLLALLKSDKKVALMTFLGLPKQGNWSAAREALGITNTVNFTTQIHYSNPYPATVTYKNQAYRYGGFNITDWCYSYDEITPEDCQQSLLSANLFNRNVVLFAQNGSKIFVNGNNVHMEASSILANLLTPKNYPSPFSGPHCTYMSRGELTALIAVDSTDIDISLPYNGREVTIVQWNDRGEEILRKKQLVDGRFTYTLPKWNLLVIDGRHQEDHILGKPQNITANDVHINGKRLYISKALSSELTSISLFNLIGRKITTVKNISGAKSVPFHTLATGTYIAVGNAGEKMLFTKRVAIP